MPRILTPEQLKVVDEKLKMADENIRNLNAEINTFLHGKPAAGFSEDQNKRVKEWMDFHKTREIPPRFGVLAGEVLYQLRSSLDHIAWILSSDAYRKSDGGEIYFPIFIEKPVAEKELARYERQVKGITSSVALGLIERVQPYHAGDRATDQPLAIVQKLNRMDKHRTIVLVVPTFDVFLNIPRGSLDPVVFGSDRKANDKALAAHLQQKIEIKAARQIAFKRFGQRENQTVSPCLVQLADAIRNVVKLFEC